MEPEVTYDLNGRKLTEAEFLAEKAKIESQEGVKLVEVEKGKFKTRLHD